MPELPDIALYVGALRTRIVGRLLLRVRLASPFLLRSIDPQLGACENRRVLDVQRIGKRIVISLDEQLHLVLHLMIAGRLRWKTTGARIPGRFGLACFDFESGSLLLTEAGSRKRAALHVVRGAEQLRAHDPGGIEVLESNRESFAAALRRESHTLKRTLTDPRVLSGIGNAYSDEILHRARLSPFKLSTSLDDDEIERLYVATRQVLAEWTARLREETGDCFPEKVTAFRAGMAVHGRYGRPCPVCGSPVQRIVYTGNEANYCATCQTGGRLFADRALSRLLKSDWPRSLEELERLVPGRGRGRGSEKPPGVS